MTTFLKRHLARAAALVLVVMVAACESSDKIPPKGSTVTVGANPATIAITNAPECTLLLHTGQPCGTADIVATVASELGTPLPDQDVRFSSTAGFLFTGTTLNAVDAANIPISTDDFGNAHVNLITTGTATITARSGPSSGTLTINTVSGNLTSILLNNDTTSTGCSLSTTTVTSCSQTICLQADAKAGAAGVPGVALEFKLQNNVNVVGPDTFTFNGVFTPSQATTNSSGQAFSKFTPDSTCTAQCGGGKACKGEFIAQIQGGGFTSSPVQLTINIP